jgi:hypothetical protein
MDLPILTVLAVVPVNAAFAARLSNGWMESTPRRGNRPGTSFSQQAATQPVNSYSICAGCNGCAGNRGAPR